MTEQDIKNKNLVLISFLENIVDGYKIKAEYNTNDNDTNVIVVQETSGQKIVFFDEDTTPLFNYYDINIYGTSIQDEKETSVVLGNLIGKSILTQFEGQTWQIIFKQLMNPMAVEYMDIRRVAYVLTLQCIVNRVQ